MKQRIDFNAVEPNASQLFSAMDKYLSTTNLTAQLRELIKIRVSQINGCAFCIESHTKDARKAGETEQRIYALSAWHESPLFTDEERAVFALTDEVTKISEHGVSDETFTNVQKYFTDQQVAQLLMAICHMNFLNRIAISTKMFHPVAE